MKLNKGLVGLMAGITLLTSGCSVIDANRSLYEMDRKGKVLSPEKQMVAVDSYQKNLFRNYMEAADDTMPKSEGLFDRKPEVVYGRSAVVKEMQKERDGDGYIGVGVLAGNVVTTYGICRALGVCGDNGSTKTIIIDEPPVNPPVDGSTLGVGGSNSNIIYDAFSSGWNP
ncbi:MAG: hypothetical protein PF569_10170 [Candidatus Woesearchaeota archaeon]|jgi:hypothetical protein|nr:hypothetical protein [Candidatus Woesearchaeota archaeon]